MKKFLEVMWMFLTVTWVLLLALVSVVVGLFILPFVIVIASIRGRKFCFDDVD
jgi:hypothetical protein